MNNKIRIILLFYSFSIVFSHNNPQAGEHLSNQNCQNNHNNNFNPSEPSIPSQTCNSYYIPVTCCFYGYNIQCTPASSVTNINQNPNSNINNQNLKQNDDYPFYNGPVQYNPNLNNANNCANNPGGCSSNPQFSNLPNIENLPNNQCTGNCANSNQQGPIIIKDPLDQIHTAQYNPGFSPNTFGPPMPDINQQIPINQFSPQLNNGQNGNQNFNGKTSQIDNGPENIVPIAIYASDSTPQFNNFPYNLNGPSQFGQVNQINPSSQFPINPQQHESINPICSTCGSDINKPNSNNNLNNFQPIPIQPQQFERPSTSTCSTCGNNNNQQNSNSNWNNNPPSPFPIQPQQQNGPDNPVCINCGPDNQHSGNNIYPNNPQQYERPDSISQVPEKNIPIGQFKPSNANPSYLQRHGPESFVEDQPSKTDKPKLETTSPANELSANDYDALIYQPPPIPQKANNSKIVSQLSQNGSEKFKSADSKPSNIAETHKIHSRIGRYTRNIEKADDAEASNYELGSQTTAPEEESADSSSTISSIIQQQSKQNDSENQYEKCGRYLSTGYRIYSGENTQLGEFPWMAHLEYRTPNNNSKLSCAGTLIGRNYVLTAAHCVRVDNHNSTLIGVRLGDYDTTTDPDCYLMSNGEQMCADPSVVYGIDDVIVHENFVGTPFDPYDIALLRLPMNVTLTKYTSPICLPEPSSEIEEELIALGWGDVSPTSSMSDILQKISLPHIKRDACELSELRRPIAPSQLCAGGEKRKDTCMGDSGGPLMQINDWARNETRWEIVGVTSHGAFQCGQANMPGIYIDVKYFLDWIKMKIGQ